MLKQLGKPIGSVFNRKKGGGFDFEITQSDLASFPSSKVTAHGSGTWQVGFDSTMGLNYLHNIGSHAWLLKLMAWALTDTSRCYIQFYFANALSSGGAWTLRGNTHTPMMNKTDWKFRGYERNDIRFYNYVDQRDSPTVLFPWLAINTLYEMEVRKEGANVSMHIRTMDGERSDTFIVATAWWTGISDFYCLHTGKWGGAIADFRYTHVGILLNS
jgi:hypothetical protein